MLIQLQLHRTVLKGGGPNGVESYMMHIALSTRLLAPNRGQEGRACLSKRKPHISLYPGVCCFVECWLSVSASSEPKPPTASQRRSRVDCASAASAERGGAATADCSPSPGKLKPVVKTSTSSRRRSRVDPAPTERLGDEGPLWRSLLISTVHVVDHISTSSRMRLAPRGRYRGGW